MRQYAYFSTGKYEPRISGLAYLRSAKWLIYIYECIFRCIGSHRLLKRQWERRRRTGPSAQSGARTCTPQPAHTSAYVSIRQHTSAYVSIRQHASAYVHAATCAVCAAACRHVECELPFPLPQRESRLHLRFFFKKIIKIARERTQTSPVLPFMEQH